MFTARIDGMISRTLVQMICKGVGASARTFCDVPSERADVRREVAKREFAVVGMSGLMGLALEVPFTAARVALSKRVPVVGRLFNDTNLNFAQRLLKEGIKYAPQVIALVASETFSRFGEHGSAIRDALKETVSLRQRLAEIAADKKSFFRNWFLPRAESQLASSSVGFGYRAPNPFAGQSLHTNGFY